MGECRPHRTGQPSRRHMTVAVVDEGGNLVVHLRG